MKGELKNGEIVYECPHCSSKIYYDEGEKVLRCEGCGVVKVLGVLEKIKIEKSGERFIPNVLLTAERNEDDYLLEDLEELGEFRKTSFRDVIVGKVKDRNNFLQKLNSGNFPSLSRVVPVDKILEYSEERFKENLMKAVKSYAEYIGKGESFKVRFKRRGMEDKISSQQMEKEIGSAIFSRLKEMSREPEVDLENPDNIVLIESIDEKIHIGYVSREIREKNYMLDFLP